jgi:hypothetical protein
MPTRSIEAHTPQSRKCAHGISRRRATDPYLHLLKYQPEISCGMRHLIASFPITMAGLQYSGRSSSEPHKTEITRSSCCRFSLSSSAILRTAQMNNTEKLLSTVSSDFAGLCADAHIYMGGNPTPKERSIKWSEYFKPTLRSDRWIRTGSDEYNAAYRILEKIIKPERFDRS